MRVTRRQLQLAKINNETETVIEFEEFLRCDVEKAEKSKKEADLKKNILEKSGHQTARHPNNEAFITNVSTTKLVANQDRAPFLGDNEENVAYPQFQLTEVHESPDEAPRDRSMIRSPADSGIGENAEIGISGSDLSIYADELDRQNDNLTLDVVGRNSVDRANVVVETVDLTEMSTEIRDYKTEPVWSDDEYEVPANKSLSYGEKIEDYQRFKFNKELTELSKINRNAVRTPGSL